MTDATDGDRDGGESIEPDQVSGPGGDLSLGDLFGTGGPPGLPDLGGLMAGMAQVQAAQAETYQGQAGGGAVKVSATGTGTFVAVTIDPEVVAAGDVEMLQDLMLAALNDVSTLISQAQEQAMGGFDLGGLDLGGLLGPGGGPE
jgi:DNA-binding protein YbaB